MPQSVAPEKRESLAPGVWGVVATPFQGSTLDVDLDSLSDLVERYQTIGTTGLTVLGVFGEAAALTAEERRQVLEIAVECTSLPLVVGVTALATRPAIEEIRAAQEAAGNRLAAVMVQANSPKPDVVAAHLDAIHRATGAKVVLQDYPLASGVTISTACAYYGGAGNSLRNRHQGRGASHQRGHRQPHRRHWGIRVRRPWRPGPAG